MALDTRTAAPAAREIAPDAALDAAADRLRRRLLDLPPRLDPAARHRLLGTALQRSGGAALRAMLGAMRGPGRLTLDEVLYYRLLGGTLDGELGGEPGAGELDAAAVRRFVGKRRQTAFHFLVNAHSWQAAAADKLLFHTAMAGAGLPVPRTLGVLGGAPRPGFRAIALGGLADFLRGVDDWPVFAKPVDGMYSVGTLRLAGLDGDAVEVEGRGAVPVAVLERYMAEVSDAGYLLQACLRPAAFARDRLHGGLPSVRLMILLDGADIRVESAILKIPGPGAIADNYWREGNAVGAIDARAGALKRVVTGTGPTLRVVAAHPGTGRLFAGLQVPGWEAVVELGRTAAATFPGIRTQSWDVALSDAGPVLLEVNWGGDLNLHQLAHRRGALTPGYCAHLRRAGWKGPLPA